MERRVFVAILLSFAVLYGYQALFVPPQKPRVDVVETKQAQPATPLRSAGDNTGCRGPESPLGNQSPRRRSPRQREREIVVDTATSQVVLTNRGGRILHWRLKDYRDAARRPGRSRAVERSGRPARPFSLIVDDAALTTSSEQRAVSRDRRYRWPCRTRRSSRRPCRSSIRTPPDCTFGRSSDSIRRTTSSRFPPSVMNGDRALNPTIAWGPGSGRCGCDSGRWQLLHRQLRPASAGDLSPRW